MIPPSWSSSLLLLLLLLLLSSSSSSISEHVIDILKSMYSNNRCQVKVGSRLSREFYTSNPRDFFKDAAYHQHFFKICIDISLRRWSQKCHTMGLPINHDYKLYNLLFADDQVINHTGY
jgi:hypothetical protein